MRNRVIAILLIVAIALSILPVSVSALDHLSLPTADAKALLNSVELHPQRTGYMELDELMESIIAPYKYADTYTKVKGAYDWIVRNVRYSWEPYSKKSAPAYEYFAVIHDLTYEKFLQESAPFEVCNRSYHAMKFKKGVCYDYAAAMALLLRYIGIDAFVHTGTFLLEQADRQPCHHGWTEAFINGEYYILDPQREYRLSNNGVGPVINEYFLVPQSAGWRYSAPEYAINAARDAKFLPVAAERIRGCNIVVKATSSGKVSGGGYYPIEKEVTLNAEPVAERAFSGWFDQNGQLLSGELSYTFTVTDDATMVAVFEGEFFTDVSSRVWYYQDANEAGARRIISGVAPYVFAADEKISRAMAVTILARAVSADTTPAQTAFTDVPENSWYSGAVAWANQQGIVRGVSESNFSPKDYVTREQFITMLMRLVDYLEKTPKMTELTYSDSDTISRYAVESMQKAATIGLLNGYEDGTIRPQNQLTRAEGVALMMRLLHWLGM